MALVDLKKIGLHVRQDPGTEITDPGIPLTTSVDCYIPPETQEASLPQRTPQTWKPIRWVQSILARKRITEEAAELIAKAQRLSLAPDTSIRYFFDNDLPRLISLSRLQPALIQKMLRENETNDPWFRLVQVACGDASAILPALDSLSSLKEKTHVYLYGLQKVAAFKPLESTHLLQKVFEKGDLNTRLVAFRAAIFSPHIGEGKLVGDLFVKLMAATTHEERKETVEPFLQGLLQKSSSNISKASEGKLAWLNALYHGWRQEALA